MPRASAGRATPAGADRIAASRNLYWKNGACGRGAPCRQLFLAAQSAHQPAGAIGPSTILQASGAMKKAQPSH